MNNTRQADIEYGKQKELEVYDLIKDSFPGLIHIQEKYSPVDFISHEYKKIIELKSRKVAHDRYPTTMIGLDKLRYADNHQYSLMMFFHFTDGLYWCEYTPALDFVVEDFNRTDRMTADWRKNYAYIPISQLKKFE